MSDSVRLKRRAAKQAARVDAVVEAADAKIQEELASDGKRIGGRRGARASNTEVIDRRQAVVKLRLRGHSFDDIADKLGIAMQTARKDWEAMRINPDDEIKEFNKVDFIKQTVLAYEDIFQAAWHQFDHALDGTKMKLDSLKEARSTLNDKIKAMKDLGLVAENPTEVNHNIAVGVIAHWTPEFRSTVSDAIVKGMLTPNLPAAVPDDAEDYEVVDAEYEDEGN